MQRKTKVLLVDDHPVFRCGLAALIDEEPDFEVKGQAASTEEALKVAAQHRFDLAIVDVSLQGHANGLELVRTLRASFPRLRILVLSMHARGWCADHALEAGAQGYLTKQESSDAILAAMREALACDPSMRRAAPEQTRSSPGAGRDPRTSLPALSAGELEVLRLTAEGVPLKQIEQVLGLDAKTIAAERTRLCRKLGVDSPWELMRLAIAAQHLRG